VAKHRQADGRFRGSRQPITPSPRTQLARWVEAEALRRKTLGVRTFADIAEQLTKVGRGETPPVVEFPPGLRFPTDYSISAVACWKACQKALARGPRLRAQEMRDIDSDRLEDGILAAQKGIKKGDPGALQALSRLITTKARLNGYLAPQKMEVTGKSGGPVEIKTADDDELSKMLERLTQEEVQDFLRLLNKAKGVSVEPNQLTAGRKEDEDDEKSN
jgi:hypothetical protein